MPYRNRILNEEEKILIAADFHYLSARLLFIHGLFFVAYHLSAISIEQYAKCLQKIKYGRFEKGHKIMKRMEELKINLDITNKEFIMRLEESYKEKYPDEWREGAIWCNNLELLDSLVKKLRNLVIFELKKMNPGNRNDLLKACINAKDLFPGNTAKYGGMKSIEILYRGNNSLSYFEFLC